jgi:hypothetical protein
MDPLSLLEATKKRPRESSDTSLEDPDFPYGLAGLRSEQYVAPPPPPPLCELSLLS